GGRKTLEASLVRCGGRAGVGGGCGRSSKRTAHRSGWAHVPRSGECARRDENPHAAGKHCRGFGEQHRGAPESVGAGAGESTPQSSPGGGFDDARSRPDAPGGGGGGNRPPAGGAGSYPGGETGGG